jgi:site-specific recombinase XerD
MLQDGYLDQYVQQLLGHRSIVTTKDIYSHVLDEKRLEDLLKVEGDE